MAEGTLADDVRREFSSRLKPLMPPERTWRMVHAGRRTRALIEAVARVLKEVDQPAWDQDQDLLDALAALDAELEPLPPEPKNAHCGCSEDADRDFCTIRCAGYGCTDFAPEEVPVG